MVLGPTHEEVDHRSGVAADLVSYRQLPITLYQIQTKFRNEERPRFGVLRTSEFLMKDAYSFDATVEAAQPQLRRDVRRLLPHLPPLRPAVICRRGRERPDRRRRQPRVHGPGRQRRGHDRSTAQECGYAANQERAEIGARNRGERRPSPPEPTDEGRTRRTSTRSSR